MAPPRPHTGGGSPGIPCGADQGTPEHGKEEAHGRCSGSHGSALASPLLVAWLVVLPSSAGGREV